MKNILTKTSLFLSLFGLIWCGVSLKSEVLAQYYGSNTSNPKITVDKKVRPINDSTFYDNIDPSKKVFFEGEQIEFKIVVENTGNQTLTNVKLIDLLPKYLNLIFYPGVNNKTDNNIVENIGSLEPGKSKEYLIRATISNLPTSTVVDKRIQEINKVNATSDQASDNDQASYFVALKSMPATGANDILIKTVLVTMSGLTALGLRKLSRGY